MRACRRYALKVALLSTIQCQKDPLKEPRPLLPSDPANWYNKEEGCALSCALRCCREALASGILLATSMISAMLDWPDDGATCGIFPARRFNTL